MLIPFNRPKSTGSELQNIQTAIEAGRLAGDGPFTKLCEDRLRDISGSKHALLTHSCTGALDMAAILLGLKAGDEVIMPSYTFVSTANAVVLRGATPVFIDIRNDTFNLDETLIEQAITKQTKAIFVVHYGGVPCDMTEILNISRKHGIPVVEDAAQALASRYRERPAGSFGDLACFSFHETKNIVSGEGGCLAINSEVYLDRAEIIREKGTNRKRFMMGEVDKYTWVDVGSSFLPGELVAAYLFGQLESIESIQAERFSYWERYSTALSPLLNRNYRLPSVPQHVTHNAHVFYVLAPTARKRNLAMAKMKKAGVVTPFHYVPLHDSPAGRRFGRCGSAMIVTNDISSRLIRLPLFPGLGDDQHRVIQAALANLD